MRRLPRHPRQGLRPRTTTRRHDDTTDAILAKGYQGYFAHEFIPTRDPIASLREAVALCDV